MKALIANRLDDGIVVFWNQGDWVEHFGDAQIWADEDHGADNALAEGQGQSTTVVDVYLIDVAEGPAGLAPVSYRERLKALGPTNHLGHGKQAEGGADIAAIVAAEGASRSTGRVNLIKRK